MRATSRRQDSEDTVVDGKEENIECSTTGLVLDGAVLIAVLVRTVGDGSSSDLVDDTEDLEAGDRSGMLGGLALSVVEVCRGGDDRVRGFLLGVSLSSLLHHRKDHSADFSGSEAARSPLCLTSIIGFYAHS